MNMQLIKDDFLQEFLVCAVLFFMPLAYIYPGRLYYHICSLHNINVTSLMHLFLLPSIIFAITLITIRIYLKGYCFLTVYPKKDFLSLVIILLFLWATISYLVHPRTNMSIIKYGSVYISLLFIHFSVKDLKLNDHFYANIFIWLAFGCVFILTLSTLSFFLSFNNLLLIHKWIAEVYSNAGYVITHQTSLSAMNNISTHVIPAQNAISKLAHNIVPAQNAISKLAHNVLAYNNVSVYKMSFKFMDNILATKILSYMINTFGNVDNMAAFLVLIVPLIFSQWLNKHNNIYQKILFGYVTIMALINLAIIGSRAALVIILLSIISICFVRGWKALFICLGILIAWFSVITIVYPKYAYTEANRIYMAATFNQKLDTSVSDRMQTIQAGFKVLKNNLLFGAGIETLVGLKGRYTAIHQFNLRIAVDIGIFGGIMSLIICLLSFVRPVKIICSKHRSEKFNLYALSVGPAAFFVYAMLAGAPLVVGVVNTWLVICTIFLTLSYYY